MDHLTAVVLAGGKGSRLEPLTVNLPKPLVCIQDRPIIEILIKQLHKGGVRNITLAVGHRANQINEQLGDGSRLGVQLDYSVEKKPLSTVGPIKLIKTLPEHFIVANADILTDLDIGALYKNHVESKASLTVAAVKRSEKIDYGVLMLNDQASVVGFQEKPRQAVTVSMGIYVFSKSLLEQVPDDQPFGFDQLMLKLLDQGERIKAYLHDGYWRDIGRPEDYLKAHRDLDRIGHILD